MYMRELHRYQFLLPIHIAIYLYCFLMENLLFATMIKISNNLNITFFQLK